jgi:hypothetical protein
MFSGDEINKHLDVRVCVCVCIYIYIYIYRERERERTPSGNIHEFLDIAIPWTGFRCSHEFLDISRQNNNQT